MYGKTYTVKWRYLSKPEEVYEGTVFTDSSARACKHFHEEGKNYITSCIMLCDIPTHMQEKLGNGKIIKKEII